MESLALSHRISSHFIGLPRHRRASLVISRAAPLDQAAQVRKAAAAAKEVMEAFRLAEKAETAGQIGDALTGLAALSFLGAISSSTDRPDDLQPIAVTGILGVAAFGVNFLANGAREKVAKSVKSA